MNNTFEFAWFITTTATPSNRPLRFQAISPQRNLNQIENIKSS